MSAELVDPFATHEPDLTPEEWVAIRDTLDEAKYDDHALFPECFVEAFKVLGDVALQGDPFSRRTATQCLRAMAYRAKTGVPFNEPQEPAWSLDADRERPFERTLSDGDGDLG